MLVRGFKWIWPDIVKLRLERLQSIIVDCHHPHLHDLPPTIVEEAVIRPNGDFADDVAPRLVLGLSDDSSAVLDISKSFPGSAGAHLPAIGP